MTEQRWAFQATGDETEIYVETDDEATPIVLVPFPDGQTIDRHQEIVKLVTNAPALRAVLLEAQRFIDGFEDDELQDGINDLIAKIHEALA